MKITITDDVMTPEGVRSIVSWEFKGRQFCVWGLDAALGLAAAQMLSDQSDGGLSTNSSVVLSEVPST